ncbi:HNH endonuclease [Mesorhizobium sp.]|uniref:HNH endonuclease n=1 Tax=Mesorhizobium sp. TaxID=1871066 RepID=UPI000FE883A1|nr:HNH endonuclease [Mesorhizobium sp.]RWA71906.1 MAG: HNH endonuclease [Mesorhizobium sp.]RWA84034.1 MAG: HNH endonuclease [Mesorhizobium sp.]
MAVKIVIAVTDGDWFNQLRRMPDLAEVNFWSPSPKSFRALQPGELFLFKLHAPINMIVGGGIFASSTVMPLSLAWEAFGANNGVTSLPEMRSRILRYRKLDPAATGPIEIGCRILTQPFFLDERRWFPPPPSWSRNIVSFTSYGTDTGEGAALWEAVQDALGPADSLNEFAESQSRFGEPALIRPRLGQGAFRLLVTDLYGRRCAITKERTLPALEAAHIRPYAEGGEHSPNNGILMRRDIHSLFDQGYVTITPDHRFKVSRRIRDEFENGRHYYELDESSVAIPSIASQQPDKSALVWHNNNRYLG